MKSLLFLLLTCSNTAIGSTYMNYNSYNHDNYWKMTPEVVICKNQTVFTKNQVIHALEAWGEKYTKIVIREKCNYKIEIGKIKIIDGKKLKTGEWGYTSYFFVNRDIGNKTVREHDSALVQLDRNVTNVNLLIHELGHAFGYDHYDRKDDVMNSYEHYDYSGKYLY
tara:strand:- start:60 stop:557 length:498 start_codon:yes stop_codon:yes gene_type:complete